MSDDKNTAIESPLQDKQKPTGTTN